MGPQDRKHSYEDKSMCRKNAKAWKPLPRRGSSLLTFDHHHLELAPLPPGVVFFFALGRSQRGQASLHEFPNITADEHANAEGTRE